MDILILSRFHEKGKHEYMQKGAHTGAPAVYSFVSGMAVVK